MCCWQTYWPLYHILFVCFLGSDLLSIHLFSYLLFIYSLSYNLFLYNHASIYLLGGGLKSKRNTEVFNSEFFGCRITISNFSNNHLFIAIVHNDIRFYRICEYKPPDLTSYIRRISKYNYIKHDSKLGIFAQYEYHHHRRWWQPLALCNSPVQLHSWNEINHNRGVFICKLSCQQETGILIQLSLSMVLTLALVIS